MRILHVKRHARPVGGAETYLLSLMEHQARSGDEPALLHADLEPELPGGVAHRRFEPGPAGERWVDAIAPDVIHVHDDFLPPALEGRLQHSYPLVRFLHDFGAVCAAGFHYFRDGSVCTRAHGPLCLPNLVVRGCAHRLDLRPPVAQYSRNSRRLPLVRSAVVTVASEYMRSVVVANGVPLERCHVVPYFVERPVSPPAFPAGREIAFLGRLVAGKGLDLLIRALAERPEAWSRLAVVGDGWDRERCEELTRQAGLRSKVEFLGWLPGDETSALLRRAALLAVPSRWPEPFGIVGLEAMAQARPVVATARGAIPEWLEHERTGLLADSEDARAFAGAIASLLDRPDRAEAMGLEGWRRVARFSAPAHLERLDAVYRETMGSPIPVPAAAGAHR
ncbi:MAG: glycosyltransferase family 4 protein [Actinobacteria bacterium]|nr:glycosyltransferase family 4 protein [Actinomycetota bacterium]